MTTILVDANGKAILYYNKAIKASLPTGYTEVAGVTNAANTYLNTDKAVDTDDLVFELKVTPSTGSWYIFQARQSSTIMGISGSGSGNTITLAFGGSNALITSSISRNTSHTYYIKATVKNGNATLYVKDLTSGTEDTKTATYTFSSMSNKIFLWGNSGGGRVNAGNTIYYARLYKSGSCILDYVPAVDSNNVAGMYDRVSDSFKTVSGGSLTPVS